MDIIMFGQQNWDHCWTAKQHFAVRLAERGNRVLYVDPTSAPPASVAARARALLAPLARRGFLTPLDKGLWVHSHQSTGMAGRLAGRHIVWSLTRAIHAVHFVNPIVLTLTPRQHWLQRHVDGLARLYYCVDEWTAFPGLSDVQKARFRDAEEAMLTDADVVLGVSPRLCARFRQRHPRVHLLPNGADVDHFALAQSPRVRMHPAIERLPAPRVLYVGQVDERLDLERLQALSRAYPEGSIVLAGRVREGFNTAPLDALANVHLLGYYPYPELPSLFRGAGVCIAPYASTELTHSCNPLKIYEYLATGLPVVATPVEGLGECRDVIRLGETPEAFVSEVGAALRDPAAGRDARLRLAQTSAWDYRVDALEAHIHDALHLARQRRPARRPRMLSGRAVPRRPFALDPKDDSEYQLHNGFEKAALLRRRHALALVTTAAGRAYAWARALRRLMRGQSPKAVDRILVVRGGFLGDLLVFSPTLRAVRARYPQAHITLAVKPGTATEALFGECPYVDEVRELDFLWNPRRRERLKGIWNLLREGYDLAVAGASYFVMREALFCGAPKRIGLFDGHPWQRFSTHLLPIDPNLHEAENNLMLARALGADTDDVPPQAFVDAAAARDAAQPLLDGLGIPAEAPVIAVHPGSARETRRWPIDRFAELLQRYLDEHPDAHALITGVADEVPLAQKLVARLDPRAQSRAHAVAGQTTLAQLVGLVDRAGAVVSNDTGVMHLARARNRPLLALLGPENDRRWGPYPAGPAPLIALRNQVPCAPCVRQRCDGHFCMRTLTVEDAAAALRRLVSRDPTQECAPLIKHHLSWRQLAGMGFELPQVTIVLLASQCPDAAALTETLHAALEQTYPAVDVVMAADDSVDMDEGVRDLVARVAPNEVLAHLAAELITVVRPGQLLEPTRVARDVAALYRSPRAAAASAPDVFTRDRMPQRAAAKPITVRRELLPLVLDKAAGATEPAAERRQPAAACIAKH
jgi:ADP-heptose:LPS heptosyltransferase/glycosyltransferase involved in cell wall biosynthesis